MVAAANARGITVTAYVALIYVSPSNRLFVKSSLDRRDGSDSPERSMFRWDEREPEGTTSPAQGGTPPSASEITRPFEGGWAWSDVAGRWYATSWGLPALDYGSEATREYAKAVIRYWMDLGVQGFEYDAPQSYWGMQDADEGRQTEVMIATPHSHRPDLELFLQAEGAGTFANQVYSDRVGFTHVVAEGGDDVDSFTSRVGRYPQTLTVDQLEDHWTTWVDPRRANSRGVYAGSLYDADVDPRLRALEVAVKAGMGAVYQVDNEHLVDNAANVVLPDATLERIWDVFRTLRTSSALWPDASRERLPTQADPRAYAILRRSADGARAALNLYNFSDAPMCITVDLAGSGVKTPQRATDLSTGAPGPWLPSPQSAVPLPPYGWMFLDVEADPGFPWTIIDDADPRWTSGGGWARLADPSAYGGSRIGGNVHGGFADVAFQGVSVQGWGSTSDQGAARVGVAIDGVRYGVHSQQRTAPVPGGGGTVFYGQRLFSITDLANGPHVLRLEQESQSGVAGSATSRAAGIDYLRVSDVPYHPARPVANGKTCDG